MPLIDQKFLNDIGIDTDDATLRQLDDSFTDELSDNICDEIFESLSEDQALELLDLMEHEDPHVASWLSKALPNLRDIVEDEITIMYGTLAERAAA